MNVQVEFPAVDLEPRVIVRTSNPFGVWIDVEFISGTSRCLVAGQPNDFRVIGEALIEIADNEEKPPEPASEPSRVVDLMAALEASVAAAKEARRTHKKNDR